MAESTAKFLENVFKIRRMKDWVIDHPEQWQQFSDWAGSGTVDSGKLNENQRKWLKYLKRNIDGSLARWHNLKNGFLEVVDFPPTSDLSEADWKQLFLTCQATFVRMKANKASYHGDVQDFITNNSTLFADVTEETMEANPRTDTAILDFLEQMEKLIPTPDVLWNLFEITPLEVKNLVEPLRLVPPKKDYNTKKNVREKIQTLVRKILPITTNPKKDELKSVGFTETFIRDKNINLIIDDYYGWHVPEVTPAQLANFKANYSDYFTAIYKDNKILDAYKSCEPENKIVSESIEKAKKDIDYDDTNSKNYIPRKLDEDLTLVEQIQKWTGDTYEDYFKKYEELRGSRIYQHATEVKSILKQIDKAKIKTTDPLSKLAESADNITKALRLTHPEAADAFEWLGNALKEFNANPAMSKVMEKALKSGKKMNDLISELIMRAAEDGKPETVKKAEIAMEVLATIKYGNTTSKVMNNLKEDKELFNIFSNKDLSWNKNEGVKFVTGAIDKTFRAACLGVGYGTTFLVNRFRRNGTKFNGRLKNDKMRQAHEDWISKRGAERLAARGAHGADIASAPIGGALDLRSEYKKSLDKNKNKRAHALGELTTGLGVVPADADQFVEQYQEDLNTNGRNREEHFRAKMQPYADILEQLNTALGLRVELDRLNLLMGGAMTDKQAELTQKLADMGNLDLSILRVRPGFVRGPNVFDLSAATELELRDWIAKTEADHRYQGYQRMYSTVVSYNYEKQQHIDDYRKATREIKIAEERIEERKKKMEKLTKTDVDGRPFDIYKHLMGYWDTLQDPSLTRFGPRRASKIQANNNALVTDLFRQKMTNYTLS